MNKKLSIIIPVYNVQNYLRDCINSILDKSINTKMIEIILVDDGSIDNSGKICDEYNQNTDYIRAIHIKNSGQSVARNIGLEHSTGEWITYVDSDDITRDGYVELLLNILRNVDSTDEIIMFNYEPFESSSKLKEINSKLEYNSHKLRNISKAEAMYALTTEKWGNYLWNKIFPRKILNKIPLPAGRIYEDISVLYKYFHVCNQIKIYEDIVYFYRQREGSAVHLKRAYDQYISMIQAIEARQKQLNFFKKYNYIKAFNNAKYGFMLNSVSLIKLTLQNKYEKTKTYYDAINFLKKYDCSIKRDGLKHYLFIKIFKLI